MRIMEEFEATSYSTVSEEEGVNYREIASTMTDIGYKMNHSSARNYVLRIMRKFAKAVIEEWGLDVSEGRIDLVIKMPQFQQAICEILQTIESEKTIH